MQNILVLAKRVDLITVKLQENMVDEFLEEVFGIKNAISSITRSFRNSDGMYEYDEHPDARTTIKTRYRYYGLNGEYLLDKLITNKRFPEIAKIYRTVMYEPSEGIYIRFCPVLIEEKDRKSKGKKGDSYMLIKDDEKRGYDGYVIHIQNIDGDKLVNLRYVFRIVEWLDKNFRNPECRMNYKGISD